MLSGARGNRRVLLAVKEPGEMRVLQKLMDFGFGDSLQCMTSRDGVDATSKIQYQKFQCIILDADLPKKSGEAILNSIRNSALNEDTPVILLQDEGAPDLEKEFSAVQFFNRPIDGGRFLELAGQTMGLGQGDQRLCASLINFVTTGIQDFFSAYRHKKLEVVGPQVGIGAFHDDDLCIQVTLDYSSSKIQLVISFSKDTLSGMKNDLRFLKTVESPQVAKYLVLFTFQKVMKTFSDTFKLQPEIIEAPREAITQVSSAEVIYVDLQNEGLSSLQIFVLRGD